MVGSKIHNADVIIIGSGAGGSIAAQTLAQSKKRVIVVEESTLGGSCAKYSCLPTKALLETASTINTIKNSKIHGVDSELKKIDSSAIKHWVNKAVSRSGVSDTEKMFSDPYIHTVKGRAHFVGPNAISVGLTRYSAKYIIVATGASTKLPKIEGLESTEYVTYRNFFKETLPKSVCIIGGSSTGYEYAQIYAALGVKVHILEAHYHLFPEYDSEVGDMAEYALRKQGCNVNVGSKVLQIKNGTKSKIVMFNHKGQNHTLSTDEIFIATGHAPNTDLGLENANVTYDDYGIKTNLRMQTSQKHIFAIGDVVKNNYGASSAMRQGQIAAHNILHRKKARYQDHAMPKTSYGTPEIVVIGKTENQVKLTGEPYQTSITPLSVVGRSFTSSFDGGFVKLIASHYGVVIGASIVAPNASDMCGELAFAIQYNRKACEIAQTVHPFSSWSEAVRSAASKIYCI
jgi:dihydrolipoamide dehydrogenase